MKTVNHSEHLDSNFSNIQCVEAVKVSRHFSLSNIQKNRGKEFGFVSYFLSDDLFPQRQHTSPAYMEFEILKDLNPENSFDAIVRDANTTSRDSDLLFRIMAKQLLQKRSCINNLKAWEIILPIISVKEDVRGFYLVPSLKFRFTKWEWWANVAINKVGGNAIVASLKSAKI